MELEEEEHFDSEGLEAALMQLQEIATSPTLRQESFSPEASAMSAASELIQAVVHVCCMLCILLAANSISIVLDGQACASVMTSHSRTHMQSKQCMCMPCCDCMH